MKIKGFIITGLILVLIGSAACIHSAMRDDFEYKEVLNDYTGVKEAKNFSEVIEKISYDGKAEELIIKSSDASVTSLSYTTSKSKSYDIKYDVDLKCLTIVQNYKKNFFNFSYNSKFTIILPKTLVDIDVEINAGSAEMDDLTVDSLSCDINAGSVKVTNSTVNTMEIEVDTGHIGVYSNILENADLNVSVGSINLTLPKEQSAYKINGKGEGSISITHSTSLGSIEIIYNKSNEL